MTKFDLTRTIAAIACTIVMSATCLLGAVGPAQADFTAAGVTPSVQRSIA